MLLNIGRLAVLCILGYASSNNKLYRLRKIIIARLTLTKKRHLIILAGFTLLLALTTIAYAQQAQLNNVSTQQVVSSKESINPIRFPGVDGFLLSGQYFAGKEKSAGVLLLHDCRHDSRVYQQLNTLLSASGLHVLAVDLRGFGGSESEIFSYDELKKKAKSMATFQSELLRISSFWPSDVLTAYQYLRARISKASHISVVSAGCSAKQAINLAASIRINSFVMITPELTYAEKEQYKNLIDIPVYFIASIHDAQTYQSITELFAWNGNKDSTLQTFKGDYTGNFLMRRQVNLTDNIASWLKKILIK